MSIINFDQLPIPEPSGLVGFSQNRLIRDAENRTEKTLADALRNPETGFYLFTQNRVILHKGENAKVLFTRQEAADFKPLDNQAILLGNDGNVPRIAMPVGVEAESLQEPWTTYDFRSLLYSASVSDQDASVIAQAGSLLHWNNVNQYCGKCGTGTQTRIGGYRRDCPSCDIKQFPRTDPVVIMLAVRDDKCLLGRSPHFPAGWFSTLAGFVEPGETIEDAVRRETFEESGIRIGRVKYHASQPWPFPHSLMIGIHCEAISEKITMDESELEDCRWFTHDEVKLMRREEHPDGYVCPPNKAISSALIKYWVEG